MDETRKTQFGKRLGTVVGIALGLVVGIWAIPALFSPKETRAEKMLEGISAEMNKSLPLQIDDITRLVGSEVEAPRTLRYRYEVAVVRDSIDVQAFHDALFEQVRQTVRGSVEMEPLKERKVVFSYHYNDADGVHITSFDVTPADYE